MNRIILFTLLLFSFLLFKIDFVVASEFTGNDLVTKTIKEESKKLKYSINVSYHQLKGYNDKAAEDSFNKYVNDLIKSAVDTFKTDMQDWEAPKGFTSEYEIVDTVFFNFENLISVRFDGYTYYAGAAHPTTFFYSVCYDLKKNSALNLSDMFTGNYLKTISEFCVNDLIRQKNEYTDNPDVSWIDEGAAPKEENYKVFNFTDNSLLITFPVYQVASYAEGPKEVNIPYTKIMDVIDKKGPLNYVIK